MLRILLRAALVSGAVAAVGAAGAACASLGGDNATEAPGGYPGTDAAGGQGDSATAVDGTVGDSGSSVDAPAGDDGTSGGDGSVDAGQTTVIFLHASPSLPSIRLCWVPSAPKAPPFPATNEMPASNYAGIPVGGAAWLNDATGMASLLGGQLYAIRAKIIAAQPRTCAEFLCPVASGGQYCLMPNADYWAIGPLPPLMSAGTNVVAIEGCLGADDPLASTDRCGPTWNAVTGNLHVETLPIANVAPPDAGLLVQAAQLSPGLQALAGDGGTVVSFGAQGDADGQAPIAELDQEGQVLPTQPTPVALPGDLAGFGQLGFSVDVPGGADAAAAGHLWMSLAQAQQLVSPAQDPNAYYGVSGTYVVAILGDPNAPHAFVTDADAGYDGKGLHLLLLPAVQAAP